MGIPYYVGGLETAVQLLDSKLLTQIHTLILEPLLHQDFSAAADKIKGTQSAALCGGNVAALC